MITISRKFKDISLSFTRNPVTNDVIALTNEDAIKKSVINLVKTRIGERFYNRLLGCGINDSMFEQLTPEIVYSIQTEISTLLRNYEPRIKQNDVIVTYPDDSNELNVRISYDIVGLPVTTQKIEFILEPSRI